MNWMLMEEINNDLPTDIRVFSGFNAEIPLKAWFVQIKESVPGISTRIVASNDKDRRETLTEFAEHLNACVVVNGGYFLMNKNPTDHVGLLMTDYQIRAPAIQSVVRRGKRYHTARGALGLTEDGRVDIAWVTGRNDTLFEWLEPIPNSPNQPQESLDYTQAIPWKMQDALHAGPVLITDGKINITVDQEVFFGSKIPDVHPRTAVGYTKDGKLILLVVDGRQISSRGVYLEELAAIMKELGCVEAINLDGGGSSAIVVNGKLLNRPVGRIAQREVMSAIAIFCTN